MIAFSALNAFDQKKSTRKASEHDSFRGSLAGAVGSQRAIAIRKKNRDPPFFLAERQIGPLSGLGFLLQENSRLTYGHTDDGGDAQRCNSKKCYG